MAATPAAARGRRGEPATPTEQRGIDDLIAAFQEFGEAAGEVPDSQWSAFLDVPTDVSGGQTLT